MFANHPCPKTGPVLSVSVPRKHDQRQSRRSRNLATYGGKQKLRLCSRHSRSNRKDSVKRSSSYALHGQRDALSHSDAHGGQRKLGRRFFQLMHCRKSPAAHRSCRADAQRDRPTRRVHVLRIFGQSHLPKTSKGLAGKCFVQLDPIEISNSLVQASEQLVRRRNRTKSHDTWRHPSSRHAQDSCSGSQTMTIRPLLRRQRSSPPPHH